MLKKERCAAFPGSFDPLHKGHIDVIKKASILFDKLFVIVSFNQDKKPRTPIKERFDYVKKQVSGLRLNNVFVKINNKQWTIKFIKKLGCRYIVRSIRDEKDLAYELKIINTHKTINRNITPVLLVSNDKFKKVSSTSIFKINAKIKAYGKREWN